MSLTPLSLPFFFFSHSVVLERWILDGDSRQTTNISPMVPNVLRQDLALTATRQADSRALALDVDPKTNLPRGCGDVNKDGSIRSRL